MMGRTIPTQGRGTLPSLKKHSPRRNICVARVKVFTT